MQTLAKEKTAAVNFVTNLEKQYYYVYRYTYYIDVVGIKKTR